MAISRSQVLPALSHGGSGGGEAGSDTGSNRAQARRAGAGTALEGRDVYALAGLPIDRGDLGDALDRIDAAVQSRRRLFISTPNSNFTAAAQDDPGFRRSVQLSDLVVPDGMPLVLFARLLRLPVSGRVTGADLFEQLLLRAKRPTRVYFFGGPPGAAQGAGERVNALGGLVHCVGHFTPSYGSVDELSSPAVLAHINACEPDFVVVALGAKKGQAWIVRNHAQLCAPVIAHLGAVINFTAGSIRRAPRWVQMLAAEWLWRIYQEPVLWRRYWSDGQSMLRILFTHVLPQLPEAWLSPRPGRNAGAALDLRAHPSGHHLISLHGDWRGQPLDALREALGQALEAGAGVDVDASGLRNFDARLTGLLMLAQVRVPALCLNGLSPALQGKLARHGGAYLLAGA